MAGIRVFYIYHKLFIPNLWIYPSFIPSRKANIQTWTFYNSNKFIISYIIAKAKYYKKNLSLQTNSKLKFEGNGKSDKGFFFTNR